jgi:predicted house-cleaning noncanonical NTP pyrophosphatase (MazG superfamily)
LSGKLVRDRIPDLFGSRGVWALDEAEYHRVLQAKLSEEVAEVAEVLELLYALADQHGPSPADLETAREAKHAVRGGFEARLWWNG